MEKWILRERERKGEGIRDLLWREHFQLMLGPLLGALFGTEVANQDTKEVVYVDPWEEKGMGQLALIYTELIHLEPSRKVLPQHPVSWDLSTSPTVSQSCRADLGTANVYNVSYLNATGQNDGSRFQNVIGGGLAPSPVVGRVMVDGTLRDVVIGANPDSFLSPKGAAVKAAFKQPKGRVYWFIQK